MMMFMAKMVSDAGRAKERLETRSASRYLPIDALRGLIIVLMALDHANYFVAQKHSSGEYWGGPFPSYENALAFVTRLVTHLAAPGFFFLMGVGMVLLTFSRKRQGWSRWRIMRFFWTRGVLLILLQFLIVNRAWALSPGGWALDSYAGVLFALGGTMILGSFLLWLGQSPLLVLTAVLFLGTELLHPDPATWANLNPSTAELLFLVPGGDLGLWSNYPILPWLELVTFGLVFGYWLRDDSHKAYRWGLWLGLIFLLAFMILRLLDGFGNIRPRAGDDWIDFFNVVKYPPSMTFTLLTTGVNLVVLWLFSQVQRQWHFLLRLLSIFGRAPLFFYVTHLFLYAGIGLLLSPNGTTIPRMIPFWIVGLLILIPICAWYGRYKGRQPAGSPIRYL
jgi:uncharacterized membrane protein